MICKQAQLLLVEVWGSCLLPHVPSGHLQLLSSLTEQPSLPGPCVELAFKPHPHCQIPPRVLCSLPPRSFVTCPHTSREGRGASETRSHSRQTSHGTQTGSLNTLLAYLLVAELSDNPAGRRGITEEEEGMGICGPPAHPCEAALVPSARRRPWLK